MCARCCGVGWNEKKACLNEGITHIAQHKKPEEWEKGGVGQT